MNSKYRMTILISCFIFIAAIFINACRKSSSLRYNPATPIDFIVPEGFPAPAYNFNLNRPTLEGFALGRKLFHDNRLSKNADVTCGSCHQQVAAFTTFDHDLGHGTGNQHTRRNVPAIFNMAWNTEFEWDGRITNLDAQPLACMTAPEKMGEDVNTVIDKLNSDSAYKRMFGEAFGNEMINADRISKALTQFVLMLVSSNSKYDKVKKGEAVFNGSEANGYQLFLDKCATCHTEPLFTDLSYRNNGMPLNPFHIDFGRMEITGNKSDSLKFKIPSLRNVAMTAYYAHDGRFVAISEMLNHYSDGVVPGPTLDPSLQNKIPLTSLEKFYLQEFLMTLNDSSLLNDPRFE